MKPLPFVKALDALENASWLDPVVKIEQDAVHTLMQPPALRELLHGVPQGHPLHPTLVQIPLGAWLSAGLLDMVPGTERAAKTLVGVGVVAAVPTVLAGLADYADLRERQARVALVHAAANGTALVLYSASFLARGKGRYRFGKCLSFMGFGVAAVGGYLGGDLTYRQGAGVDRPEFRR